VPRGAKQPELVTRFVIPVDRSKIAELRKRLFESVKSIGLEFRIEEASDAGQDDCERWAVTLSFAPVATPRPIRRRR